jgi:hypothetical protein
MTQSNIPLCNKPETDKVRPGILVVALISVTWAESRFAVGAPGLFDAIHTNNVTLLTAPNGNVVGIADIIYPFAPQTGTSKDAWFYDGNTTVEIGLGSVYGLNTIDGRIVRYSRPTKLNNAGDVIGYSKSYGRNFFGVYETGQVAWLYNGSTSREIGLYGGAYDGGPDVNGYFGRHSEALDLDEAGHAVGLSTYYVNNIGGAVAAAL